MKPKRKIIYAFIIIIIATALGLSSCGYERRATEEVRAVDSVNPKLYQGKWYEIARYPHSFQKGCTNVFAEYRVKDSNSLSVNNFCLKNGKPDEVHGTAVAVADSNYAKYKVHFRGFPQNLIAGNYWIVMLDGKYRWAVVSERSGSYLWILSRKPYMNEKTYNNIVAELNSRGFKTQYLQKTVQNQ